uniref:Uncharacterized protein n=1 Tax=Siphoviridae sp. ct1yA16 TaxID=2827767 RepID=A0A8S5TEZ7_9CAUD|nr:MAG TPA: hypothetical protein [Siphoviridae sp. ct1yA16]
MERVIIYTGYFIAQFHIYLLSNCIKIALKNIFCF